MIRLIAKIIEYYRSEEYREMKAYMYENPGILGCMMSF